MVGIASEWDRRLNRIVRHRVELGLADEKDEADEKKKRLRSAKVNEAGMGPRVRRERLVERARGGGTSGGGDKCVESVGHEVETLFAVRVEWDWLADTTLRRCPSAKLGKRERVSATNTTHTHARTHPYTQAEMPSLLRSRRDQPIGTGTLGRFTFPRAHPLHNETAGVDGSLAWTRKGARLDSSEGGSNEGKAKKS